MTPTNQSRHSWRPGVTAEEMLSGKKQSNGNANANANAIMDESNTNPGTTSRFSNMSAFRSQRNGSSVV